MAEFVKKKYVVYFCSSLCRLSFYELDFGWGKPIKVPLADSPFINSFILMDTPSGDGIEVMVSLEEQEMGAFQLNEELGLASFQDNDHFWGLKESGFFHTLFLSEMRNLFKSVLRRPEKKTIINDSSVSFWLPTLITNA
ncbi:hypothetical protein LguiB_002084 [Lonicera macranthoides]